MAIAVPQVEAVRFRLRPDLQFSEYPMGFSKQLVVKDPVKLEYFLFDSLERKLLNLLTEPKSADDLKKEMESESNGDEFSLTEIGQFLHRLFNDSLVVMDSSSSAKAILQVRQKRKRLAILQSLTSILAIRFKGINPAAFLDLLNPYTKFLFQPGFLAVAVMAFGASVLLMLLNIGRLFESDALRDQLYRPESLVWIGLAVVTVKVFHELGHAFACHSINRNCHEIGVLLLAFVPCLYCNVSDVWMEPRKWKRMIVSAAGIYVEMLIAVCCIPIWVFSAEGSFQIFWLAIISICTLNTLFINGNPLLRYDGYYVLSDWLEIPNLYTESQKRVDERIGSFFFRNSGAKRSWSFLESYGIFARVYRYVVLFVILGAIYSFFERLELRSFGAIVTSLLAAFTFGVAIVATIQKIRNLNWVKFKLARTLFWFLALVVVGYFSTLVEITPRIFTQGKVSTRGNAIVFAPESGRVEWEFRSGDTVRRGERVGVIHSSSLQWKILDQKEKIDRVELELKNLEILRVNRRVENSAEIELANDALSSARKILSSLQNQQSTLNVMAAEGGELIMLPQPREQNSDSLDLRRRDSTLRVQNQGSFVVAGEPIAIVMDKKNCVIELEVSEQFALELAVGQEVKMLIRQYSSEYQYGKVLAILDRETLSNVEKSDEITEVGSGHIVVQVEGCNMGMPSYQSNVSAVILTEPVNWPQWIWRKLRQNFEL